MVGVTAGFPASRESAVFSINTVSASPRSCVDTSPGFGSGIVNVMEPVITAPL